jgi:hypothetical protein
MKIALLIFGLIALAFLMMRIYLSLQFNKEVKTLFAQSKIISNKFNNAQLAGLPEPVQRYFKLVLKQDEPYISYARITHDGQFKTGADKDWMDIEGEQYATTEKPGFIWKGKTSVFTARDMYIGGKGRLVVSLFSLIQVADSKGESYNQGELLRWLGESVLYPTNLLPGERLQWSAIDTHSAKLTFNYNDLDLFFIVTFNAVGEIKQIETKRYMDKEKLETWIIKLDDYKKLNEILVPTRFEVLWRLKEGDLSYAKFNLRKIEYNKPERF